MIASTPSIPQKKGGDKEYRRRTGVLGEKDI